MIDAEKANYTIVRMCRLLGVDRRRYYEWRRRQLAGPTRREQRMADLVDQIRAHHEASDGTYGAPRILHDLRDAGHTVSRKTDAKAMRHGWDHRDQPPHLASANHRSRSGPRTGAGPGQACVRYGPA
ncbi:hypothetical protein C0Z11_10070 [Acidipropionibacterium jensenii]|nr:hypothetical protein C0Z11_10070 [Acidipropionibacterium jensenii]